MERKQQFGESVEMYLKTISELAKVKEPVPVTSIAERLGITTVSASEMIHRLEEGGLLRHEPYKGVYLTKEGSQQALGIIRRQRLWECFLADKLGIPWEHVQDFACRLEHTTDDIVANALEEYLDYPTTCPHGNPIPSPEGKMESREGVSLTDLLIGERGVILSIYPESALLLGHLAERGIEPGGEVEILEIAPFNGPRTIQVGGEIQIIGREVAAHVLVQTYPEG